MYIAQCLLYTAYSFTSKNLGSPPKRPKLHNTILAIMLKSVVQCVPTVLKSRGRSVSQFRPRYGAFINGKEVFPDSNEFFKVYAPATDEVLCEVASTDKKALNDAVEVADEVYRSGVWSRADVRHRANVLSAISVELKAAIPELLELEVAQTGRAVREMKAQVYSCVLCRFLFMQG